MLKNKNILITGVGKGIGRNLIQQTLDSHANVFGICKNKNDFKNYNFKNKNIKIFYGDVTNKNFIKRVFSYFIDNKIKLHGLVNNAGIRQRLPFKKIQDTDIKNVMNVNFFSVFFIIQNFLDVIDKKNNVSVVNIGSIVGNKGFSNLAGYASSKTALEGLTKCLAIEISIKQKNFRINNVNPGFVKSSYYNNFKINKKSLYKWTIKKIPMKRWGELEEISNLVVFLLSDKSSYINGQSIYADGGWTVQ